MSGLERERESGRIGSVDILWAFCGWLSVECVVVYRLTSCARWLRFECVMCVGVCACLFAMECSTRQAGT